MIPEAIKSKSKINIIQWLIISVIGLLVGVYILFIFKLPSRWIPLLIFAAIFPFVVLVTGNLRKILITLILLDIPLQLDIALRPSWVLNHTGAINGYIVSITTICLAALYAIWLLEFLIKKDTETKQPIRRPNLFLTLYLAITCLSLVFGNFQLIASFEIFLLAQMFLLYFYVINNIRSRDSLVYIVVVLLVGLIAESLIIMLMQVIGQGFNFAGIMGNIYSGPSNPGGISRIGGTLQSANSAGSYLSMLMPLAFSILLTKLKRPYKWLGLIAFICGVVALILTGSRGAWLGSSISFLAFGIFSFRRGWLDSRIVVIGAVIGIIISLIFFTPIYQRIFGYDAGAAAGRITQYQVAFQIIRDYPVFGVGANNYAAIQRLYVALDSGEKVFRWAVHNKYLLVWAETGFLGLLFFVLFLISTIRQGFKITRIEDRLLSPLALGLSAAIIGQMVHMFFDVFHGRTQVQLLWLIAGLLMIMSFVQRPVKDSNQRNLIIAEKD